MRHFARSGGRPPHLRAGGVNWEKQQSPGHGKGFLGWHQLGFAFPPPKEPCASRTPAGKLGRARHSLPLGARQPRRLLLRAWLAADAGCGTAMIYSCFAEAWAAQAAGDIPSNTSAGEIKQSAYRGQTGQEAASNIPGTFPGATVIM